MMLGLLLAQRRCEWAVRVTQKLQILAQDRIITRVLRSTQALKILYFAESVERRSTTVTARCS